MARVNLSDNVTLELEKMICDTLQPGDRLPPEVELAERFSVGRSTMRESMKALVARGIITRRNEGTFVAENLNESLIAPLSLMINMEIGKVQDLLELRELLELGTIKIAAGRSTPEQVSELEQINWRMQEPGASAEKRQALDIEFHNSIVGMTGNAMLMELLNALRQVIAKNIENPEALNSGELGANNYHRQLIDAIAAHDGATAHSVLEAYFAFTRKSFKTGAEQRG